MTRWQLVGSFKNTNRKVYGVRKVPRTMVGKFGVKINQWSHLPIKRSFRTPDPLAPTGTMAVHCDTGVAIGTLDEFPDALVQRVLQRCVNDSLNGVVSKHKISATQRHQFSDNRACLPWLRVPYSIRLICYHPIL